VFTHIGTNARQVLRPSLLTSGDDTLYVLLASDFESLSVGYDEENEVRRYFVPDIS
jgi:hypothetical protein